MQYSLGFGRRWENPGGFKLKTSQVKEALEAHGSSILKQIVIFFK